MSKILTPNICLSYMLLFLILGVALGFAAAMTYFPYVDKCSCDTCDIRFNKTGMIGINGVYNSNEGYMCIVTEGRTAEEIGRTMIHEASHYYLDQYPDHFKIKE